MPEYRDFLPTLRFQSTLALSPDGTQVAYVDDALGQFNIVVQSVFGGEPQRLTSYSDSTVHRVCWYPDGESILFLADTNGNENAQIYRARLDGGEPQALTDAANAEYALATDDPFSPDGRRILFAANDRSPSEQDIQVRDLKTGETHRIFAGSGRIIPGGWSPDGRRISIVDRRGGVSDHVVYVTASNGGSAKQLTDDDGLAAYWLGPWLPNGSGILVMSDLGREFTELAVLDAETGELSWLDTPGWDVEEVALSRDGRTLLWSVNIDGVSQLRMRDLTSGLDLDLPTLPMGVISEIAVSSDGRTAVMLLSTPTRPTNVAVLDRNVSKLRWLTDSKPVGAHPATFVEPALVSYPARDGRQIPGYLYRPQNTSKQTGVVLAIHGGPPVQERPSYSYDGFFQYLVSCGLAVFAPNVRGSSGYGMSYQKLSYRDWGGGDLGDFADATRFLHRQDWADPKRIGLYGGSYGGFAVLSCVARLPELDWAAAVDWCGPSNLVTFTRSQPPTWRSKVAFMVGDPDADQEFLMSRSPVTYADQIRAPLLVIQGANDPRVPKPESDQIVERLRSRGVDVQYDVYADEGHVFGKRENQITARSSAADFLVSRLR